MGATPTVLTLAQLETLMWTLISGWLGTTDQPSAVRTSWSTEGQPPWDVGDDVCFLRVTYEQDAYSALMELQTDPDTDSSVTVTQAYVGVIGVTVTLYGPNSFDRADLIRSSFLLPVTTQALWAKNLGVAGHIPMPRRAPELSKGQWWERTDFSLRLYEGVLRPSIVPAIASAQVTTVVNPEGGG